MFQKSGQMDLDNISHDRMFNDVVSVAQNISVVNHPPIIRDALGGDGIKFNDTIEGFSNYLELPFDAGAQQIVGPIIRKLFSRSESQNPLGGPAYVFLQFAGLNPHGA